MNLPYIQYNFTACVIEQKSNFMKPTTLLICFIFYLTVTSIKAQETSSLNLSTPEPVKKIDVCEVSILGGFSAQSNQYATLADYTKLAPNSKILQADLSNYSKTSAYGGNSSGMFSVLMGIRFGKKDGSAYRNNPIFRMGFNYMNSTSLASGFYKSESKPYDTLLSYQTGKEIYVDSMTQRNYNISYSSQQIRLDLSLIYRTDGKARWNFYSGIGVTFGTSLNAYTNISYYANTSVSNQNYDGAYYNYSFYPPYFSTGGNYYYTNGNGGITETFKNKNNTAFSAYIPLGVDFRLGKKRVFWKRTHLFCEFRPGVNSVQIPELGTYNTAFFQGNFGLKINWEN